MAGPPNRRNVPEHLLPFWPERTDIHLAEGVLLKGKRILIPACMRTEMLDRLHEGHQGATKCVARAQESLWWPGTTRQIKDVVERYEICCQFSQTKTEPLMSTPLPPHPWQKVAADIFQWKNSHYIVVVDYFSRYIEVANLPPLTTATTVKRLKVIFARFGMPECLVTGNSSPFASSDFSLFAQDYGLRHATSSPRYPQSNGEAERAVRTVKQLLSKSLDPQRALLAYRATPLAHGLSPAQLLMGRRIRSTVPTTAQALYPAWPSLGAFRKRDKELKERQNNSFDRRHKAKDLPFLIPGQSVWIRTIQSTATVQGPASTSRSYVVETERGSFRRNRAHLTVPPETELPCSEEPVSDMTETPGYHCDQVGKGFPPTRETGRVNILVLVDPYI
uniref:Gypsy retrotransposon integrase-like protein 1 n=1 Tax=Nothobranchius kuhntae TaxID=321403 RepID=A0A1A8KH08_NOTKU